MDADVIVVGAGHNGLVAAAVLAGAGLRVQVLEEREVVGGAARTEYPFRKAPGVGASTGAYLLGPMPPELLAELDLELPPLRRDPHYFLPTEDGRHLLLGSDDEATRTQLERFFSPADVEASARLDAELAQLREDVAPAWLAPPGSIEETAERYLRPALRSVFVDLCRGSVGDYLDRFGFASPLLQAMYAVTDGFTGSAGGWRTPGTGMNFLVHNMCRLPGSDGTWMIVRGGMGTVSRALADCARRRGAVIRTGTRVAQVEVAGGVVQGVALADGRVLRAPRVLVNADPFRMLDELLADAPLPADYRQRVDGYRRDGVSMKVNLCLRDLPRFTCLPEPRGQHGTTIHLLPLGDDPIAALDDSHAAAMAGYLPERPTIEWYTHSTIDPSLRDEAGRHSAALFVQWVPYALSDERRWEDEKEPFVERLLAICDRYAPGTSALVDDVFALTPADIEAHFGIHRGHIHHVDNTFGFADRLPYATPVDGLWSCSAGTHPGGSVIGAAGWNAARELLSNE